MLRIAFVGAGQVNFGGGEGPWNHAKRLEELNGSIPVRQGVALELKVVAIYDPFLAGAERVLERQRSITKNPSLWKDTRLFTDYNQMFESVFIDAVFIGVPPGAHGSMTAPNDIEVQCAKRNIHMFVEKPLSCHPVEDVQEVAALLAQKASVGLVVSVGYMFRYSQAIKKMKDIINEHGTPRVFMARYNCAYSTLAKEMWWDTTRSGGPIVEQATHVCDLARYLVGEVDLDSVMASSIKQTDPLGKLSQLPGNIENLEEQLPEDRRIPRVTSASWKFTNGAIGTLVHGVLLHRNKYETEIEIWGDGYRLVLTDPYGLCQLSVRLPNEEETVIVKLDPEDIYYEEDKAFLKAITSNGSHVASTYEDAFKTYQFTWQIRKQCEERT